MKFFKFVIVLINFSDFLSLNGNMLDGSLGAWISSPQAFPLLYLLDLSQNAFTGDGHTCATATRMVTRC
jgi:hypothetical protein